MIIPLTKGYETVIDEADWPLVQGRRWCAQECASGIVYARESRRGGVLLHRLIMGAQRGQEVDHKDGDGLNNSRASNLRLCAHRQNMANSRKCARPTSSQYKGVSWKKDRRRWGAYIYEYTETGRRRYHIGYFRNEEDAARARDRVSVERAGEFARVQVELTKEIKQ